MSAGTDGTDGTDTAPARPLLRVVRGDPSPEEVAALAVVLASAGGGGGEPADTAPRSAWADRAAMLRRPLHPGPGAWRMSGLR